MHCVSVNVSMLHIQCCCFREWLWSILAVAGYTVVICWSLLTRSTLRSAWIWSACGLPLLTAVNLWQLFNCTVRATRVVSRVCSTGIARQQCIITWYSCPAYLRYSVLCFIIQWSVVVNVNITVMLRWIKVRFLAVCYSVISVGAEGATERSPLQFLIWGHR